MSERMQVKKTIYIDGYSKLKQCQMKTKSKGIRCVRTATWTVDGIYLCAAHAKSVAKEDIAQWPLGHKKAPR